MDIKFIVKEKEYSFSDCVREFEESLPVVFRVNQGYQGYLSEDTFGKDEILFISSIIREKRVAARVQRDHGRCRVISLPETFTDSLSVNKNGHGSSETSLSKILHQYKLPVKVNILPNLVIFKEGKRFHSNQLPTVELQKTFRETYMIGNLLTNGLLDKLIRIPSYLSKLRFCQVTGIEMLSDRGGESHLQSLLKESKTLDHSGMFDNSYALKHESMSFRSGSNNELSDPVHNDALLDLMFRWPEWQHFFRLTICFKISLILIICVWIHYFYDFAL